MKNKILKRALCLLCCFSLTLGAFLYRPSKAEASFLSGTAALGCAVLISTIIGTTADMAFDDVVTENIGNVIDPFVQEFVDFAGGVYENVNEVYSTIAGSANPLAGGVLALSDEAGVLIARFINWLQTEKGLEAGGASVDIGVDTSFAIYNGFRLPNIDSVWVGQTDAYPYAFVVYGNTLFLTDGLAYVKNGKLLWSSNVSYIYYDLRSQSYWYEYLHSTSNSDSVILSDASKLVWASFDVLDDSGAVFMSYSIPAPVYDDSAQLVPKSEFQSIPNEIPAGQALTVNTGLTDLSFADEQAAADSIFSAALAGTLSPTVAVEDTATDVPGTDTETGTDTDNSILSWTKKIWQTVTDLPGAIASEIASAISGVLETIFAPDAALVNEMTTAFSAKFGFVDTLKQIGDDLFGMTPDTQPPVVYIHLEDAEGKYTYGGTVKALDMTWYQRYKADVDRIFGGFLWIAYLWLLFRRAPDILAGAGLVLADNSYIDTVQGENGEKWMFRRSKHL